MFCDIYLFIVFMSSCHVPAREHGPGLFVTISACNVYTMPVLFLWNKRNDYKKKIELESWSFFARVCKELHLIAIFISSCVQVSKCITISLF